MACEQQNSFNGAAMVKLFYRVRLMMGQVKKVAFFGDNASINKCGIVKDSIALEYGAAPCKLLYNVPYRPDLVSSVNVN